MTTTVAESTKANFADAAINRNLSDDEKIGFPRRWSGSAVSSSCRWSTTRAARWAGSSISTSARSRWRWARCLAVGENDHVITAYRDHGHALAVGMGMNECMAELFGKETGCSKGKGGSMHFFAPDKNFWGGHGIVAGQTPLGRASPTGSSTKVSRAAAFASSATARSTRAPSTSPSTSPPCSSLPVVFIIENNGYSMGTSRSARQRLRECLAQRAEAYDMAWDLVNGEDLYEIRAKTHIAMERARKEHHPTLLEIDTYRYYGHSMADANARKVPHAGGDRAYKETITTRSTLEAPAHLEEGLTDEDGAGDRQGGQGRGRRRRQVRRQNPRPDRPRTSTTTSTGRSTTAPRRAGPAGTSSTTEPPMLLILLRINHLHPQHQCH